MELDFIYVANFKMFLNHEQEKNWLLQNLNNFADFKKDKIIIAPTFTSLDFFAQNLKNSEFQLCAQNCSSFENGAYTSQVSAQSLHQVGCKYCIIGHYEARKYLNENDGDIFKKAQLLLKNNIIPIICIGENMEQLSFFKQLDKNAKFMIAYEPIWAIGTNKIPSMEHINKTINVIKKELNGFNNFKIIYGGSVTAQNITELKKAQVDGFLIGKASTDFGEFKKIILSV